MSRRGNDPYIEVPVVSALPTAGAAFAHQLRILRANPTAASTLRVCRYNGSAWEWGTIVGIILPSAYTQTYATADKTHANFTSANLATTAATNIAPWGFDNQAQAEDIATQFNLLRADVADLKQLVNSVIDDMQTLGILQ